MDTLDRQAVLDPGMAVDDLGQVLLKPHPALRHHDHVELAGRLEHLLSLLATEIVVALDRDRALLLLTANVEQRVVVIAHPGRGTGGERTVENAAGRKDARRQRIAGAL